MRTFGRTHMCPQHSARLIGRDAIPQSSADLYILNGVGVLLPAAKRNPKSCGACSRPEKAGSATPIIVKARPRMSIRFPTTDPSRSEERRVGKEGRFRWAPH